MSTVENETITCTREVLNSMIQLAVTEALAQKETKVDESYCKGINDECDILKDNPEDNDEDDDHDQNDDKSEDKVDVSMSWQQAFESNSGDVKVYLKNKKMLYVHKIILLVCADNFKSDVKEIDMTEYDPAVVYFFFRHIHYSLEFDASKYTTRQWFELLKLAKRHKKKLANKVIAKIKNALSPTTFYEIYNLAVEYNNNDVTVIVMRYITNHIVAHANMNVCYDSFIPGKGIRSFEHTKHLCCQHMDQECDLLEPTASYKDEGGWYYCIAWTKENKEPRAGSNMHYCCKHKKLDKTYESTVKEIGEFMEQFKKLPMEKQTEIMMKIIKC